MKARSILSRLLRIAVALFLIVLGLATASLMIAFAFGTTPKAELPYAVRAVLVGVAGCGGYLVFIGGRGLVRPTELVEYRPSKEGNVWMTQAILHVVLAATWACAKPLPMGLLSLPGTFILFLGALYAALFLIVLVHELGHLWAASLLGRRPVEIGVGSGRKLFEWRFGTVNFVSHALPFAGHVLTNSSERWTRREMIIFAGAGPIANFLLALSLVSIRKAFSGEIVVPFGYYLMVCSALTGLTALIPTEVSTARGRIPSDGQRILAALFPVRYGNPKLQRSLRAPRYV